MAQAEKNPATCSSAIFGNEPGGQAFALLSCAAWLNVSLVDHRGLSIRRGDTYVFPPEESEEFMKRSIGKRARMMCDGCDRFTPIPTQQIVGVAPYALPVYAEGSQGVIGEATFAPAGSEPIPPIQSGTN